jgi:hypothetical protein
MPESGPNSVKLLSVISIPHAFIRAYADCPETVGVASIARSIESVGPAPTEVAPSTVASSATPKIWLPKIPGNRFLPRSQNYIDQALIAESMLVENCLSAARPRYFLS